MANAVSFQLWFSETGLKEETALMTGANLISLHRCTQTNFKEVNNILAVAVLIHEAIGSPCRLMFSMSPRTCFGF